MTPRLAAAINPYLREGRPSTGSGFLFVTHRAPLGRGLKAIGVRDIVIRRAADAGLAKQVRGTHVLRHSVATALINAGASITEIADLLGHKSIDTTRIYTKVDLQSLARVALPWPIRSFLRHAASANPLLLPVAQRVLAIPGKRFDRAAVQHLTRAQMQAILDGSG